MKALFYLEPSVFRNDPLLLLPWAGWVARIAAANAGELSVECAGNVALMEQLRSFSPVTCHALTQAECTGAFGFDRMPYLADLNEPESDATRNEPLFAALERLANTARADVVVSFTANRYLRRALKVPVLFSEMGALPRSRCHPSLFFDPLGHQRPNLLQFADGRALHQDLDGEQTATALGLFDEHVVAPTLRDERHAQLRELVSGHARGRRLSLLALQPPDWITYEGLEGPIAPCDLLSAWASALPAGWAGLVSYHPAYRLPESMERWLAREHDNLIFLPDGRGSGSSELLLPLVDAVVTISSTVGLQGALYGKPLVASARSAWRSFALTNLAALEGARALSAAQRASLLLFLTNRYGHPLDRVLDETGYFAAFLAELFSANFDPTFFFDVASWQTSRARAHFVTA